MDFTESQAIHFNGYVEYNGRAVSELGPCNLLLLYKSDNSVSIHGGSLIMPRNYISQIVSIEQRGPITVFLSKKEQLSVKFDRIFTTMPLADLALDQVKLRKTEAELVAKIERNWDELLGVSVDVIHREYPTIAGPVDLVGIGDKFHVIEVKRKKASLAHCYQLYRYIETWRVGNAKGYLASPDISAKALKYLEEHDYRWIQVDFDP